MENQTTLRVPENLNLTPELTNRLSEILSPVNIERYNTVQDLKSHYKQRINSLHEAFLFILDTIPLRIENDSILRYLKWCKDYCVFPQKGNIEDYQTILTQYTVLLVNALIDYYPYPFPDGKELTKNSPSVSNASNSPNNTSTSFSKPQTEIDLKASPIEILNKAEQYVLMKKGRHDLATLIPLRINSRFEWALLWEKQLAPYTEETLRELKEIKQLESFLTPTWFRELSPELQTYLHTFEYEIPELLSLLNRFFRQWLKIKAERGSQLPLDLKNISEGSPVQFEVNLEEDHKKLIEILSEFSLNVNEIDTQLENSITQLHNLNQKLKTQKFDSESFKNELKNTRKLPYWFLLLEEYEQHFLKSVLASRESYDELISFLPSRLRRIPMLPNFCEHKLFLLSQNGEHFKEYHSRLRSSHIASRDVVDLPQPVGLLHAKKNLNRILSFLSPNQPLLIQTLISPISLLNRITPDYTLEKQLNRSVRVMQKKYNNPIFVTNHPLNIARMVCFTSSNELSCNDLLDYGKQSLSVNPTLTSSLDLHHLNPNNKDLIILLNEYYKVLHSAYGSATVFDYYGRELFLSSLEHLIMVNLHGKSYGSCVSGKDRKQIEILHTDAMLIYREKYSRWPSFRDEGHERARFVNLVATLYVSKHIHEHAGQNAPGANGIKTPEKYWPGDIAAAIRKKLESQECLRIDDQLATNNEVSRIGKIMLSVKPGFAICLNAAHRLSHTSIKKVIDALSILSEEHTYWGKQGRFFGSPTGINKIQKLLQTPIKNEVSSHEAEFSYKLAEIYFELTQRPKESASRNSSTQTVYTAVLKLYESKQPEKDIPQVLDILDDMKKTAFQHNLRYNLS